MREETIEKDNCTLIKIRTNENMYYTFMKFPWDDIMYDDNCKTFKDVRAYAKYLAKSKIQELTFNTDNSLIFLYPEEKTINRNDIREIYMEEHIHLAPREE